MSAQANGAMGTITAQLGQRIGGRRPKGTRLLVDVTSVEVESDDCAPVWLRPMQQTG